MGLCQLAHHKSARRLSQHGGSNGENIFIYGENRRMMITATLNLRTQIEHGTRRGLSHGAAPDHVWGKVRCRG